LQVERLSDSVFYEEVADRIYNLRSFLGQTEEEYYASHSEVKDIEDSYSDILSELEVKGEWTKWTTGRQNGTTKRDDKTGRRNSTTSHSVCIFFVFFFFFGLSSVKEIQHFEPGIQEERMVEQIKHDSIVGTYQQNYDTKLRIERKKREIYYHVEGRLGDCQTAIVTATTRGG
jgi:hypothetical protein